MRRLNKLFYDLIPEFRDMSEDQIPQLYRKYYLKSFRRWELWLGLLGLAGCLSLSDRVVSLFTSFIPVEWIPVFDIISLIVFLVLGVFIYNFLVVHAINHEIRKQKNQNGADFL